jgi:hypothetical protein
VLIRNSDPTFDIVNIAVSPVPWRGERSCTAPRSVDPAPNPLASLTPGSRRADGPYHRAADIESGFDNLCRNRNESCNFRKALLNFLNSCDLPK